MNDTNERLAAVEAKLDALVGAVTEVQEAFALIQAGIGPVIDEATPIIRRIGQHPMFAQFFGRG